MPPLQVLKYPLRHLNKLLAAPAVAPEALAAWRSYLTGGGPALLGSVGQRLFRSLLTAGGPVALDITTF